MKKLLFLLIAVLGAGVLQAQTDYLVVFTDKGTGDRVMNDFNQNYLEKIEELEEKTGIKVLVRDAADGLPTEVTALPAIFYVNSEKRIYYKGRYSYVDKVKTFINNQRTFEFDNNGLEKKDIFIGSNANFEVGIVPKYFALAGTPYEGFEQEAFNKATLNGLAKGFSDYKLAASHTFPDVSKLYYLNVYPYRGSDGKYWVSAEVFSQHSCVEPILTKVKVPFSGNSLDEVMAKIGAYTESVMPQFMSDLAFHDGLYPVNRELPTITWSDLNLSYQEDATTKAVVSGMLPQQNFKVVGGNTNKVSFSFLPPVSHYAGAISSLNGGFSYKEDGRLLGQMKVKVAELDMGDESLNSYVKEDELMIKKYPEVVLRFEENLGQIELNKKYKLAGTLDLTAIQKPVEITVEFQGIEGQPEKVEVKAGFSFNINPFPTLAKPDGPAPFNETIIVATTFEAAYGDAAVAAAEAGGAPRQLKSGQIEFYSNKKNLRVPTKEFEAQLDLGAKKVNFEMKLKTFVFPSAGYKKHALGGTGLEADKFPKSRFKGKIISDEDLTVPGTYEVKVEGELTLHGFTKPYTMTATISHQNGTIVTKSQFLLKREDFELNGARARLLDKEVQVTVDGVF